MIERALASFFSGLLLSLSGSTIQCVTQNDLAGPSTLGFQAGVVLIILLGYLVSYFFPFGPSLELVSISFFLFACVAIWPLMKRKGEVNTIYRNRIESGLSFFILFGLCFNLFTGALLSVIQFLFLGLNYEFPRQLWYGNFKYTPIWSTVFISCSGILCYVLGIALAKNLRPLTFGLDFAQGLGLDVRKVQIRGLFLALISLGLVSCFYGVFSFMGLVFPHFLRSFSFFRKNIFNELRYGTIICGFSFMMLDVFCREVPLWGQEIPVGMLSSLLGTFLLLLILLKKARKKFESN